MLKVFTVDKPANNKYCQFSWNKKDLAELQFVRRALYVGTLDRQFTIDLNHSPRNRKESKIFTSHHRITKNLPAPKGRVYLFKVSTNACPGEWK